MSEFNNDRPVVEPIIGISELDPRIGKKQILDKLSMIFGIIAAASVLLLCCCGQWYITLGFGIAAVVCGIMGKKRIGASKGKCKIGIILGIIGIVCAVLLAVYLLLFLLTDGMFLINIMMPFLESGGIDTTELTAMMESGASLEEILEWLRAYDPAVQ